MIGTIFSKGQRVRYIPNHANGDQHHPDCKDGVVKRPGADGSVFVIYDNLVQVMTTGDEDFTAASTKIENLIHL